MEHEIAFTCKKCKKMFSAKCSVNQSQDSFVSGLECDKCFYQATLDMGRLDFDI